MKLLLENWREYVNEDDKFSGNCGMFAIALGDEALRRGKEVVMVVAHNAENLDDLLSGEPDVYHVAVEIDGTLYDGKGEVSSVDKLLNFIGDPFAKIDYLALDETFKRLVRTQTNWSVTCEEYAKEAARFLDKHLAETNLTKGDIEDAIQAASFNSNNSSSHRWSRGQPYIDYWIDKNTGKWMFLAGIPDGTPNADNWPKKTSKPGESLQAFLERVPKMVQFNLGLK